MIVVVMGVSGSGKTTVGARLADALKCSFLDGDTLHSETSVAKMSRGIPLTDADRAPWLSAIHERIAEAFERGEALVVACSALKQRYRDTLAEGVPITWVYLKGSADLIRARLTARTGHFMGAAMLASQFEALEEPEDAIVVDAARPPEVIVQQVVRDLGADTQRNPACSSG